MSETIMLHPDEVQVRHDVYPRAEPSPALIQQYAASFAVLPPIEVNQDRVLIDGNHRLIAAKKNGVTAIAAQVTPTASDRELLELAITRNNAHGAQLSTEDKRRHARTLFSVTDLRDAAATRRHLAQLLSVPERTIREWTARIEKDRKAERSERIFALWLSCYTQEEIGEAVGVSKMEVSREIEALLCNDMANLPKSYKVRADFADDFAVPLYDLWKQQEKSPGVQHFGNSEPRILERLLYLYTDPFAIVVDVFGGGGSTIDVCKRRLRRYWVSDRKPLIERPDIRPWDIAQGPPPLHRNWSQVRLVYLDPPYWKQAAGRYSEDGEDLANMALESFYDTLSRFTKEVGKRLSPGATVAMLMQPTQWHAPERQVIDHTVELIRRISNGPLQYRRRIACPYESQQATAQMVEWAKAQRELLVLTRELILWQYKG